MGLFGSKKKGNENLKTLSEKDIQARLYGHLRSPHLAGKEESSSKIRTESPKPALNPVAKSNSVGSSSTAVKTGSAPDLFKSSETPVVPQPSLTAVGTSSVTKTGDKEAPKYTSIPSKIYQEKTAKITAVPPSKPKFNPGPAILGGLKWMGFQLAAFAGLIITGILKIFASLDFRKPLMRRIVTFAAAAGVLALVFWGIHHLNLKREAAMKNAPRQTQSEASGKKKHQLPADNPLAAAITETETESAPENLEAKIGKSSSEEKASETQKLAPKAKKSAATENAPAAEAAAGKENYYAIQVATFAGKEDADRLVGNFKTEGLNSFRKAYNRSGGRVYYVVFIGHFASRAEADEQLASFKKTEASKKFKDAFVLSL